MDDGHGDGQRNAPQYGPRARTMSNSQNLRSYPGGCEQEYPYGPNVPLSSEPVNAERALVPYSQGSNGDGTTSSNPAKRRRLSQGEVDPPTPTDRYWAIQEVARLSRIRDECVQKHEKQQHSHDIAFLLQQNRHDQAMLDKGAEHVQLIKRLESEIRMLKNTHARELLEQESKLVEKHAEDTSGLQETHRQALFRCGTQCKMDVEKVKAEYAQALRYMESRHHLEKAQYVEGCAREIYELKRHRQAPASQWQHAPGSQRNVHTQQITHVRQPGLSQQPAHNLQPPVEPPRSTLFFKYQGARAQHGNNPNSGKLKPHLYGSDNRWDIKLCYAHHLTIHECRHGDRCVWRHEPLDDAERRYIEQKGRDATTTFLSNIDSVVRIKENKA